MNGDRFEPIAAKSQARAQQLFVAIRRGSTAHQKLCIEIDLTICVSGDRFEPIAAKSEAKARQDKPFPLASKIQNSIS